MQRLETEAKTLIEAARRRDQEHVAAGDGSHHGDERLREGAGRGARRRSRCAGRSVLADALGGRGDRPVRSRAAGGRRAAVAPCAPRRRSWRAGSRRSAWSRAPMRARLAATAQARPAAGVARGRSVALGRLCRRRPCADRRRAAPRRARAGSPTSTRELDTARGDVESKRAAVEAAQAEVAAAAAAETGARDQRRAAQQRGRRRARAARRRRARSSPASRAALRAHRSQEPARRRPRRGTRRQAARPKRRSPRLRPPPRSKTSSPRCAATSRPSAATLAQVRAEAQALAREAELADRRLSAIATDREQLERTPRQRARADRHAGGAQRGDRATSARRWKMRRRLFAEKRSAMISEIERRGSRAPRRRRPSAEAESALGQTPTARCAPRSRRSAPPARRPPAPSERLEGAKRRLVRRRPRNPAKCSRSSPTASRRSPRSTRTTRCPTSPPSKPMLEKLRRDRERLGAVNLRAEEELREVETQHTKLDRRARRPGRGDQAAAPGHQNLNKEARERLLSSFERGQRALPAAVHRTVRRRHSRAATDRARRSARGRPRNLRQAARQEAGDAVAALRRRAGAHRAWR